MSTDGKKRILEAARRLITRSSISGATMRAIAEEAGLSTGAIYHYYRSKEEVLYDVMDESLSESSRIARESQQGERGRAEIIEDIYGNIAKRFAKTDENRLQFYLAQEAMLGDAELAGKFKEKYSEWVGRTEELMEHLYGTRPTKYSRAFAALLIGAIDGIVLQVLLNANPAEAEDIAEVYHQLLEEGIPRFLEYLSEKG